MAPHVVLASALLALAWADPTRAAVGPPLVRDRHGDLLPPGARARLGTNRFWWNLPVLSRDGRLVAVLGDNGQAHILCAATGRTLLCLGDATLEAPGAFSH